MRQKFSAKFPKLPVLSIRTRLTLWYSSLLATVILVFAVSLYSILNWTWRNQIIENMAHVAEQTAASIMIRPNDQMEMQTPQVLDLIANYPFGVQVRQSDGVLVEVSSNLTGFMDPFDPDSLDIRETVTRELYLGKNHILVMTVPVFTEKGGKFVGTIQVLSTLDTVESAMDRLIKIMIGVSAVALVVSFMVGSVIAGQALQPIEVISQSARAITKSDDLSKRIGYRGPLDELGQLTSTFNDTLGRLEKLFLTQKRFVADVSHELRTPLTTIQGNLDMIKRFGNDPVSLEAIESEVTRMNRLVGDLLMLAQADSGRLPLQTVEVELDTLAFEVVRQSKVLAAGLDLKIGTLEPVRVKGDQDRLKQLIINLVSNAIKYTPAGGKVTVSVLNKDSAAYLQVSDTGIGIPKEDLEHIFDRFYRVDKARSRQMGGTGLGLSIASWIVEAHQGKIWAESELNKGSTFWVKLPCLNAPLSDDDDEETDREITRPRRNQIGERLRKIAAPEKNPTPEP